MGVRLPRHKPHPHEGWWGVSLSLNSCLFRIRRPYSTVTLSIARDIAKICNHLIMTI